MLLFVSVFFFLILITLFFQWIRYRKGADPNRYARLFDRPFIVAAHRGFGKLKDPAENTEAAFRAGIKAGFRYFETDVLLTSDGVPVIVHGPTAELADRPDLILKKTSFAEIEKLNFAAYLKNGSHARIMTLREFLDAFTARSIINLELKNWNFFSWKHEKTIAREVRPYLENGSRIFYSSFNPFALLRMRFFQKEACLGMLWRDDLKPFADNRSLFFLVRPDFLHPYEKHVDAALVKYAARQKYRVHTWVVDDLSRMEELRKLGTALVMTDNCVDAEKKYGDWL